MHVVSLSVCFPVASRSLIIAVKSTAKQLSKGKHRQREREVEGRRKNRVKVGEVESYRETEEEKIFEKD